MKRTASFEGTQKGYRVTVTENGKVIASQHVDADLRLLNVNPGKAADEAYRQAKKYAAQFGCA
jgi:hypothetical protein